MLRLLFYAVSIRHYHRYTFPESASHLRAGATAPSAHQLRDIPVPPYTSCPPAADSVLGVFRFTQSWDRHLSLLYRSITSNGADLGKQWRGSISWLAIHHKRLPGLVS